MSERCRNCDRAECAVSETDRAKKAAHERWCRERTPANKAEMLAAEGSAWSAVRDCYDARISWRDRTLAAEAQVAALLAAGQAYRERTHDQLCEYLHAAAAARVCRCGKSQLDAAFDAVKGVT